MGPNLRLVAWEILRSGDEQPLRQVDRAAEELDLDPRDRGLLRRIIGTEVRRRGTLRAIVQRYTHGQPKAGLAAHIRVGLAQLLFLDKVPPHAALSETVAAARDSLGLSKGRIVNGVLRTVQRELLPRTSGDPRCDVPGRELSFERPVFRDPEQHPALWAEDALNIPSHMMKRWSKKHGADRAMELARWFLDEPPLSVHADGAQADDQAELEGLGAAANPTGTGWRLPSESTGGLLASQAFLQGRVHVQGDTAHRVANELCLIEPGQRVLDLCAAPGTKALQLARRGAQVTAVDRSRGRLARLPQEAERLGVRDRVRLVVADAGRGLSGSPFDVVLIDAPCSNTGVLGARPGARWRFGPASLRELGAVQQDLLAEGSARVAPGGSLVWSVCSLEPEEGEQRMRAFCRDHPEFEVEEEWLALPGADGPIDGGFGCRLRRRS